MSQHARSPVKGWALDLDGVLWRGDAPIAGAAAAVARLDADGERVLFVTNFSAATADSVEDKLRSQGIAPRAPDGECRVVTSAMAVATLVHPGERVLVCADTGVADALIASAPHIGDGEDPAHSFDAVVVGYHRHFDYARLSRACQAVWGGARLLATNDDSTYPGLDGLLPGNGALVAAVERATGQTAVVAGKPYTPMVAMVQARLGAHGIMVGDRPDTDGDFAVALGYDFALVLSGVTQAEDLPVEPTPRWVTADLATMIDRVIGSSATDG
jgi:HAD superfamily hydrolase (TIGR01450 family)